MRARWTFGVGLLVAALSVGLPTAAHAEDPVTFGASHIADEVNALGDREAEVESALDQLYAETGTDLFVVYVDSFTGVDDRTQWADQTADKNGMGTNDVLLAVATGEREYQLSAAADFELTDEQLSDVETAAIEPALRENDWAGAAIGAADGLAASINGEQIVSPEVTPGDAAPAGSGGGWGFFWILLVAIVVIGAIVFFVVRKRRVSTRSTTGTNSTTGRGSARARRLTTDELRQQAGSALVQTDDAIKTSEQELGFAIAQYGAGVTKAFQEALGTAKTGLMRGFTLQQKLDDAEPDSDEQKRVWYTQIIQLCETANTALDEQAEDFDELRQLEKNAPEAAAAVGRDITALEARFNPVATTLASLQGRYSDAAIATVADNPEQARDRITFATSALTEAKAKIAAGDLGAAAVNIRTAEESADQTKLLLDAVERLHADLQNASSSIAAAVSDLQNDLVAAGALPTAEGASASLPGVIARTKQTLAEVEARQAAGETNPLELVQMLEAANTRMDTALQDVRDARAGAQRTQAALDQTLLSARSKVSAATDFITARRGAIGAEARTRLAEADRLIDQAHASAGDPAAALTAARRADSLATDAIRLAQNDVNGFSGSAGGFGGMLGDGARGSGNGTMGAILGGILINSMLGGGGRSRGGFFGGGGFGGGGFGGGFVGGGRRSSGGGFGSAGSFGGSATRSRRGGGGRF